jgi:hypothetical protein
MFSYPAILPIFLQKNKFSPEFAPFGGGKMTRQLPACLPVSTDSLRIGFPIKHIAPGT